MALEDSPPQYALRRLGSGSYRPYPIFDCAILCLVNGGNSSASDSGSFSLSDLWNILRKILVNGFVLLFLCVALADILPSSRISELVSDRVRPVRTATGFHQGWALFSPNPLSVEANTFALLYTANGDSQQWWPTKDMNRVNSSRHERWRKWETRVRLDDNDEYWEATARYVAGQQASGSEPIQRVRLVRTWSDVPPVSEDSNDRTYYEYHFYEWDVDEQTGRVLGEDDQP